MAFDPVDNYLVLFGGCSAQSCPAPAQTWKFAGGTWSNISGLAIVPPPRAYAGMTYDSKDGYLLLFGGQGAGNRSLNDTWAFVGGLWTNLTPASGSPPPLAGVSMTYDHVDGYVVLFGGGANVSTAGSQTWRFSAGNWKNLTGAGGGISPPARTEAGLAWDDTDGYALLFGGLNATRIALNDSWTFVHARWTVANLTSAAPSPRAGAMLSYFGQDNAIYLFGGTGPAGPLGDTWRYATGKWTNLTGTIGGAPTPRASAATLDTGQTWTQTGVRQRNGFLLLFGGGPLACAACAGPLYNDTWVLEPLLQTVPSALPSVVEVGQPAVFSALVTGGSPPYLLSWQFGDGTGIIATSPTHAFRTIGTFTVNETATDLAGVSANGSLTISVVAGPSVSVTVSPLATDVGRPVTYAASGVGGTPPYTLRWNFGDSQSAAAATTTHAYSSPGLFHGNVTATDAVGGVGVASFSVQVNPTLTFVTVVPTAPVPVEANVSVHVSVNGGTTPYQVNWSFGDGNFSTAFSATHAYQRGGTYQIHLIVRDSVGASVEANFTLSAVNATHLTPGPEPLLGLPALAWLGIGAAATAGAVGLLVLLRRRRRRRRPQGPIAAAAVGETAWGEPGEGESRSDTRSARRNALRWGRR